MYDKPYEIYNDTEGISMKKLQQIKSSGTLSDHTYNVLKEAIIRLEIKPGSALVVEEVSEQLGVSRTPIRTALNKLMSDGLVETIPGKGTYVTRLSEQHVNDVMDIRTLLECYSIRKAAEKRSDDDLEMLRDIVMKQDIVVQTYQHKNDHFLDSDYDFHLAIAEISQNPFLVNQLKILMDNFRRYLNASTPPEISQQAYIEHSEILNYIAKQDVVEAEKYMLNHLNNVRRRVSELIKHEI